MSEAHESKITGVSGRGARGPKRKIPGSVANSFVHFEACRWTEGLVISSGDQPWVGWCSDKLLKTWKAGRQEMWPCWEDNMMDRNGCWVWVCMNAEGDRKMESGERNVEGWKPFKCNPTEVNGSQRVSVLHLCVLMPLILLSLTLFFLKSCDVVLEEKHFRHKQGAFGSQR